MGLHLLQSPYSILVILLINATTISSFPIAKPNCKDYCGNVSIPFPFGTTEGCYLDENFLVTCNETIYPPIAFWGNSNIQIRNISMDGQIRILRFIAKDCYYRNGTSEFRNTPSTELSEYFTFNNTANKFTIIGCDTYAYISGNRLNGNSYQTGCDSWCAVEADLVDGSCSGLGCCQTSIPKNVCKVEVSLKSYYNYSYVKRFNRCGYAFFVEESEFNFSRNHLSSLRNVEKLPTVIDWAIGNSTCEDAEKNMTTYACKSNNSQCYEPDNGNGYRCFCQKGYEGNPYLSDHSCEDIDECQNSDLNDCEKDRCRNTRGSFECFCPKGYHGDGRKDGKGCMRSQSLVFKLVAGIASGVCFLMFLAGWLYLELKRRKLISLKEKFFLQNGGILLQEKLTRREKSPYMAKIFTSDELKNATNNFDDSRIIGQGGFGTVYKGFLSDNRIVAIMKSKQVDPNQVEQFVNEVIVLSQINHRNVVRLLGCCLETQVPLLVYEFINNGTLFEHINNKMKACYFSWDMRLRVAAEAAGVLAYLHSSASPPIIHRDVKSANILLDTTFTAKVSDFGASRLVPVDKTQLSTIVQGTFGYLDPEYLQTNQLTEKSDVYSFGVVLAELLTGKKALSNDKPEQQRNLSSYFLTTLKEGELFQILDDNIVCEGNSEQLMEVAMLAKRCLYVRGDDRPGMKEVAMELEGLRLSGKHSWAQTEPNAEEMESLLCGNLNAFANGEGNSTSTGYESMKHHIILPMGGGR